MCHKRYSSSSISEKIVSLDEVRNSVTDFLIKKDSLDEIQKEIFKFDSQNSDMTVNFRKHMVSFLVTFYTILSMVQSRFTNFHHVLR